MGLILMYLLQYLGRAVLGAVIATSTIQAMELPSLQTLVAKRLVSPDAQALFIKNYSHHAACFQLLPFEIREGLIKCWFKEYALHRIAVPLLVLSNKHILLSSETAKKLTLVLQQSNTNIPLTPEQSYLLYTHARTIKHHVDTTAHNSVPLTLTREQVDTCLSYVPLAHALQAVDTSILALCNELSVLLEIDPQFIKSTSQKEIQTHLQAYTIPQLCDLITATYTLGLQESQGYARIYQAALNTLTHILLDSTQYNAHKERILMLPAAIQRVLIQQVLSITSLRAAIHSQYRALHAIPYQIIPIRINSKYSTCEALWSPDSNKIATCLYDVTTYDNYTNLVLIWNTRTGKNNCFLTGHDKAVKSISWSPDGNHIASGSDDGSIRIWDIRTGICTQHITVATGPNSWLSEVRWSPDGTTIASCFSDGKIQLWETKTGLCIRTIIAHPNKWINIISWSPNGSLLASGANDGILSIWDVKTGNCVLNLNSPISLIYNICWSSDNTIIAVCSCNPDVRVWNVKTGQCIRTLKVHTDQVTTMSLSPDGSSLATSCCDPTTNASTLYIWNMYTGKCLYTLTCDDMINALHWLPDGSSLTSCSKNNKIITWHLYDTTLDQRIHDFSLEYILKLAHMSDSDLLAAIKEQVISITM